MREVLLHLGKGSNLALGDVSYIQISLQFWDRRVTVLVLGQNVYNFGR